MKKLFTIFCLASSVYTNGQSISKLWVADNGNNSFKNPVINADYSDPDAIRVGDDYYMIASSFTQVPGLPILHSKDLVNWSLIGHALQKLVPVEHFKQLQHGGGVWAPSIRYHNNEFYIYYPDPDFGFYLTKAKNINGPWSEPKLILAGKGLIDPCPLWDSNGKTYLVHAYAGSRAGIKSVIVVRQMNTAGDTVTGNPVLVYDGHEKDPTIEGPKFYKRNGYYYIFAPAGGVSTGWQLVLRSRNIYGPYERKVVMDQGNTSVNGPHQGAWVDTRMGEDWFLHFQDKDVYGRVVHLQPMKWVQDWPVIGEDPDGDGKGQPVMLYRKPATAKKSPVQTVADTDEFNTPELGLQWQWQANPQEGWCFPTANGVVRMFAVHQPDSSRGLWNLPNILGQKLPFDGACQVKMKCTVFPRTEGERFGLVILGVDYGAMSIVKKKEGNYLVLTQSKGADKKDIPSDSVIRKLQSNEIQFRVDFIPGSEYKFYFTDGNREMEEIPLVFKMKPGKWVGTRIGIFYTRSVVTNDGGYADIDWIRFE